MCFDEVKEVCTEDSGWTRVTKLDGKTTAWFNKDFVYEAIIEEMK